MVWKPQEKVIGYVLRRFPVLSETFVLNEILALENLGAKIHIFSLEKPKDPRFHPNLSRLKAQISYFPDTTNWKNLLYQRKKAAKKFPQGYSRAFSYTLKQMNPSLFFRFLQSCYLANYLKKLSIDHLHAHFATRASTLASLASMITSIPYSFTAHAIDIYKESLSRNALKRKMEEAKFVVTISEYNKNHLKKISETPIQHLYKVYNGIDFSKFQPKNLAPKDPFTFLNVSRFVEKKGHASLVDACAILRNRGYRFECRLLGVGKLQDLIKRRVEEKKLGGTVSFLGPKTQSEVIEQYHLSHAFVLPCKISANGDRDGLPVSMTEALACGLPVVSTAMGGLDELVESGKNGLLVDVDDPSHLADAMAKLIDDRNLFSQLKSCAELSVREKFDLNKTAKQLAKLFFTE